MELEVRIDRLGAQGDGLAQGPDGPLFVPFTLPGELVKVVAEPGEPRAEAFAEPGAYRTGLPIFRDLRRLCPPAYGCWRLSRLEARAGGRGAGLARARGAGRGGAAGAASQPAAGSVRSWPGG